MKIVFVTARIDKTSFSGGIYCILKYAQGLYELGHDVSILAYPRSKRPDWLKVDCDILCPSAPKLSFKGFRPFLQSMALKLCYYAYPALPEPVKRELNTALYLDQFPEADITIATYWATAIITSRYGKGALAYFMQHYEVYFCDDYIESRVALGTYDLPLTKITNSSWLKSELEKTLGDKNSIFQCTNAVDLDRFYVENSVKSTGMVLNLISYGGRGVDWKGFAEMVGAVARARAHLPGWTINWSVYGSAALPPDNDVASYTPLGFLNPDQLRKAYNSHDVLLSASWYESFPLFPIEAMACGLAVITTSKGTEDYAFDGRNCVIVEEKNTVSIAQGIIRLAEDSEFRGLVAEAGLATAQEFGWANSVAKMDKVLAEVIASN